MEWCIKMGEKQFQIIHLGNPYEFVVKDNTKNKTYGPFEGDEKAMSDLLDNQQISINNLKQENEKLKRENKTLEDIVELFAHQLAKQVRMRAEIK